jgi:hypothetical protein
MPMYLNVCTNVHVCQKDKRNCKDYAMKFRVREKRMSLKNALSHHVLTIAEMTILHTNSIIAAHTKMVPLV